MTETAAHAEICKRLRIDAASCWVCELTDGTYTAGRIHTNGKTTEAYGSTPEDAAVRLVRKHGKTA